MAQAGGISGQDRTLMEKFGNKDLRHEEEGNARACARIEPLLLCGNTAGHKIKKYKSNSS